MNTIYNKPYFNRRNWLLDNAQNLDLSPAALLLCLLLDYCNEFNININYELLSAKLKCDKTKVDALIQGLAAHNYIQIYVGDNGVNYDISRIYEAQAEAELDYADDIFKAFEDSLSRPLNPNELQKLSDFINIYSPQEIMDALRSADAYRKVSLPYIEKILRNNHESQN